MSDLKRETVWVVTDEDGTLVDVCATYAEAFADSSKNDFIQGFSPVTEKTLADVSREPPLLPAEPEQAGKAAPWDELLAAARGVLFAHENVILGVSRRDAEQLAIGALARVVDKFPYPCAAAKDPTNG